MKCSVCGTKKNVSLTDVTHREIELTDKRGYVWRVIQRPECRSCREKGLDT